MMIRYIEMVEEFEKENFQMSGVAMVGQLEALAVEERRRREEEDRKK